MNLTAWKSWPIVGGALGLVILSAIAVAYWVNTVDTEHYLRSRNFRLLAVLASQSENLVETRARIVRDAVSDVVPGQGTDTWDAAGSQKAEAALAALTWARSASVGRSSAKVGDVKTALRAYHATIAGEGATLRITWQHRSDATFPTLSVSVPAATELRDVFAPKLRQGAFDTLVMATMSGHVVYAEGRRASELQAMSLASLVGQSPSAPAFPSLAATISEQPVSIAGVAYRMFLQPCCRGGAYADQTPGAANAGMVVLGLTEHEALRSASLAISPVLVLAGVAFVLAALVTWPFLKMTLMGAQQRVTRLDVVQLYSSSVFGLALATILLLTTAAYVRLSADIDTQLETLADQIQQRFSEEVRDAYGEATLLTDRLKAAKCGVVAQPSPTRADRRAGDSCGQAIDDLLKTSAAAAHHPYPDFITFSLIDPQGYQRVKVARSESARRHIVVNERGYFREALQPETLWSLPECEHGCVVESHWSWTTGKPQVVLSINTGIPALPVGALSIPIRALLEPVLPAGLEFAVIDGSGMVQFHSDQHRNAHENLLLETDQNARLRSLIAAHSAGSVNTSYWGRPYRAFVKPFGPPGWSIVTLHDKQHTRSLVLEWTASSLLLQGTFVLLFMAAMWLTLRLDTSWLWPDPLRRPWYRVLAVVCVAALTSWLLFARTSTAFIAVVLAGVSLPLVLWLIAYVFLARRPPGVGHIQGWSELRREYQVAGSLLLIATAVLPAASFFAVSYDAHMEGYLKNRQIALARKVDQLVACSPQTKAVGSMARIRYDEVFYNSRAECAALPPTSAGAGHGHGMLRNVHSLVEEYMPYYTAASVEMRELLHDEADDHSWTSSRPEPAADRRFQRSIEVSVASHRPGIRWSVSSPLPPLIAISTLGDEPRYVWRAVLALLLLGLVGAVAYWIVGYLLKHVLLADVVVPLKSTGRVVTAVGQHLLVICDDPAAKGKDITEVFPLELTPILKAEDRGKAWRDARLTIGQATPVQPIAISDLDDQREDPELTRRKLLLIDELITDLEQTVVLLSRFPRHVLAASAREAATDDADRERWQKLLGRLIVVDTRVARQPGDERGAEQFSKSGWSDRFRHLRSAWIAGAAVDRRQQLIQDEGRPSQTLRRICDELEKTPEFETGSLTCDQILEEIEDRAAPLYRRVWTACDGDEKVVLGHVAAHGLASDASRRIVRRLLAKGLLRKDPELRVMNQSFQRFVLNSECGGEVAVLERQAAPSMWDRLRVPLGVAALGSVVFLVTTQREAFDATVAMAAGVTTAVPTLVKLTSILTQLGGKVTAPKADA